MTTTYGIKIDKLSPLEKICSGGIVFRAEILGNSHLQLLTLACGKIPVVQVRCRMWSLSLSADINAYEVGEREIGIDN